MAVTVKLAVQPIPKSLVRVGCAGDFVKNLSLGTLSDEAIRNIQQGVAEGLISRISVTGLDVNAIPRERFWLQFDPLTDDVKVVLDLEDGKSTLEAVDVGLASAVAAAVQIFKRKDLKPQVRFEYSAAALANPTRLNEAKQRLGFVSYSDLQPLQNEPPPAYTPSPFTQPVTMPTTPARIDYARPSPPLPPNYVFKTNLTITPAKDNGIHFGWDKLRRV